MVDNPHRGFNFALVKAAYSNFIHAASVEWVETSMVPFHPEILGFDEMALR